MVLEETETRTLFYFKKIKYICRLNLLLPYFLFLSILIYVLKKSIPSYIILKKHTILQRRNAFMKVYYNQEIISSSFQKFFKKIFSLSKPLLKTLSFIIIGIISAESVVNSDISRKLKDDFSYIQLESIERKFRRFFASFSSVAYSFFQSFISYIILHFSIKHRNDSIHISFDHMFCKDKFTILLFSLRIGKQRHSYLV